MTQSAEPASAPAVLGAGPCWQAAYERSDEHAIHSHSPWSIMAAFPRAPPCEHARHIARRRSRQVCGYLNAGNHLSRARPYYGASLPRGRRVPLCHSTFSFLPAREHILSPIRRLIRRSCIARQNVIGAMRFCASEDAPPMISLSSRLQGRRHLPKPIRSGGGPLPIPGHAERPKKGGGWFSIEAL